MYSGNSGRFATAAGYGAKVSGMNKASNRKSNHPSRRLKLKNPKLKAEMNAEERHGVCSTLRILLMDACMYLEGNHLDKSMDKLQAARELAQELFVDSIPPDEARKHEVRKRVWIEDKATQ